MGKLVALGLLVTVAARPAFSQGSAANDATSGAQVAKPVLAAQFDGQTITSTDVGQIIAIVYRGTSRNSRNMPKIQAQALEFAIDRRLVQRYVERATGRADAAQVDALLEKQKQAIESRGVRFEEYLQTSGVTEQDLRQQHIWNIAWNKYVEKAVDDEAIQEFFERNRAEYDGTQIRVRHILLRTGSHLGRGGLDSVKQRAAELRDEIMAGQISFEDAAHEFSDGPSRRHGGDLGFIARHGQMAEGFAKAAFQLQQGEISEPVVTKFGVHLIQHVEARPGDVDLSSDDENNEQVLKRLRAAVATETYQKIVALQRSGLEVEYADDFPHFIPGTQDLAPLSPQASP